MTYKCILVKSQTYAQKALNALRRKGINAYITRQSFDQIHGCARCIKVANNDAERARQIMEQEGVLMFERIYEYDE